jgi:long-chain acyl-CoA synthetase
MLIDLAAMSNSMVSVAIYDTFGPSIVEYVLNHAELSVVCCAETSQVMALLKVAPKCP